nr:hypothetical protein Iba_scaffold8347CG0030 [Ipomoea batatas]
MLRFLLFGVTSCSIIELWFWHSELSFSAFNVNGPETFAGKSSMNLHSIWQEYLRRLGLCLVRPLKLGSDILMSGPIHSFEGSLRAAMSMLILHISIALGPLISATFMSKKSLGGVEGNELNPIMLRK